MKQVQLYGPDDVRIVDVPEPEPGPRDALVRVSACGICGSDVKYVKQGGLAGRNAGAIQIGPIVARQRAIGGASSLSHADMRAVAEILQQGDPV